MELDGLPITSVRLVLSGDETSVGLDIVITLAPGPLPAGVCRGRPDIVRNIIRVTA